MSDTGDDHREEAGEIRLISVVVVICVIAVAAAAAYIKVLVS